MKAIKLLKILGGVVTMLAFAGVAAAAPGEGVTLDSIRTNIDNSVITIASILMDVTLIAGICFILASFFKFHQHKLNPTQVPISQGVSLLVIGTALTGFVMLLPAATKTIFGNDANPTKVGSSAMQDLIKGSN